MKIQPSDVQALLNKAHSKLKTARLDFGGTQYDDASSRAYYAAFSAVSALLLSKGLAFSSHGQVIGAFNREYVKTGIFPAEFAGVLQELFEARQLSDYDPLPAISLEDAQSHIASAEKMVESISTFLVK